MYPLINPVNFPLPTLNVQRWRKDVEVKLETRVQVPIRVGIFSSGITEERIVDNSLIYNLLSINPWAAVNEALY